MKTIRFAALLFGATLTQVALASTLTVGALSREAGSGLITDSLNQRQWLGWDVTRHHNHAATLAAIAAGGAWEGFKIARNADAQLFVDALVGSNALTASGTAAHFFDDPSIEQLVGESAKNYWQLGMQWDNDFVMFLSDNGVGREVGLLELVTEQLQSDRLIKVNEWASFVTADHHTNSESESFGWLLYRDLPTVQAQVPAPHVLSLLAIALLVLGLRTRRQAATAAGS